MHRRRKGGAPGHVPSQNIQEGDTAYHVPPQNLGWPRWTRDIINTRTRTRIIIHVHIKHAQEAFVRIAWIAHCKKHVN